MFIREAEAYEDKVAANRKNGRKGAQARWRGQPKADGERHSPHGEHSQDKEYDKEYDNEYEKEEENDKEHEQE